MCCASASSSPSALRRRSESVEPAAQEGEGARALLRPFDAERRRSGSLTRSAVAPSGFARTAASSSSSSSSSGITSGNTSGAQGKDAMSPAGGMLPPAQVLTRTTSALGSSGPLTPVRSAGASAVSPVVVAAGGVPSEACLVTTAVTIAWAEALMRLHILIVENGIQMPPDVLTRRRMAIKQQAYTQMLHVVQLCFDRAFVSFNTDRVTWLKESLSAHPLREILDSVLSPPQLMQKIAGLAVASTATATATATATPSAAALTGVGATSSTTSDTAGTATATGSVAAAVAVGSTGTAAGALNSSAGATTAKKPAAAATPVVGSGAPGIAVPVLPPLGDSSAGSKAVGSVVASPRGVPGSSGGSGSNVAAGTGAAGAGAVVAPANSSTVPGPAPLPSPIVHAADTVVATPQKPAVATTPAQTAAAAGAAATQAPAARTSTAALSPLATHSVVVVPQREPEDSALRSPRTPLPPS